jgi:3-oxoadipate enol-lactonase
MIPEHQSSGPPDAPALLLGSSLGTDVRMWDGQLALAQDLQLIALAHRGHGGSPAPRGPYEIADLGADVLDLMDELGLERASYCGLSLGGMIGMWLAANAPERIDRLVLICTAAHMPNASAYAERAALVRREGSTEPVADGVVAKWLTPAYAAAHPEVRARLRSMVSASDPEGYASCCEAVAAMDLRDQLGKIEAPTVVISGADDTATPVELQEAIARTIPGARHEIVHPAAHLAAVEQAERVNELIGEQLT